MLDLKITNIEPKITNYDKFVDLVKKISRKCIPRGCRTQYITDLDKVSAEQLEKYKTNFQNDPFSDETISTGKNLMETINEARKNKWVNLVQNTDMTHNSKKAWALMKQLNGDPKRKIQHSNVTANQVAHTLLENGKPQGRIRSDKINRQRGTEKSYMETDFNIEELNKALKQMKTGKAPGIDDIQTEQIKNFGSKMFEWILSFFNECRREAKIPRQWMKSNVIALLKPGKSPNDPRNFRPISLLCHLFKLYERMILNRISPVIESGLIKNQAGFRPGKSCTGQILNLTQHIEDGYETKKITGAVFVDLSAAYDTVNHRLLRTKIYQMTKDYHLTKIILSTLHNRRFYVTLQGQNSRWRNQKNGLPQGSVLAPVMFNIYTNDQPLPEHTKHFLYADDLAIIAQEYTFNEVENKLTQTLEI